MKKKFTSFFGKHFDYIIIAIVVVISIIYYLNTPQEQRNLETQKNAQQREEKYFEKVQIYEVSADSEAYYCKTSPLSTFRVNKDNPIKDKYLDLLTQKCEAKLYAVYGNKLEDNKEVKLIMNFEEKEHNSAVPAFVIGIWVGNHIGRR